MQDFRNFRFEIQFFWKSKKFPYFSESYGNNGTSYGRNEVENKFWRSKSARICFRLTFAGGQKYEIFIRGGWKNFAFEKISKKFSKNSEI